MSPYMRRFSQANDSAGSRNSREPRRGCPHRSLRNRDRGQADVLLRVATDVNAAVLAWATAEAGLFPARDSARSSRTCTEPTASGVHEVGGRGRGLCRYDPRDPGDPAEPDRDDDAASRARSQRAPLAGNSMSGAACRTAGKYRNRPGRGCSRLALCPHFADLQVRGSVSQPSRAQIS
jgi:hypothetical protein